MPNREQEREEYLDHNRSIITDEELSRQKEEKRKHIQIKRLEYAGGKTAKR